MTKDTEHTGAYAGRDLFCPGWRGEKGIEQGSFTMKMTFEEGFEESFCLLADDQLLGAQSTNLFKYLTNIYSALCVGLCARL